MSGEKQAGRERFRGAERTGKRPVFFLVLFLTSDGGWGFIYNEKDNTWIMSLFKFHPREDPNNAVLGCRRIFAHLKCDSFSQRVWQFAARELGVRKLNKISAVGFSFLVRIALLSGQWGLSDNSLNGLFVFSSQSFPVKWMKSYPAVRRRMAAILSRQRYGNNTIILSSKVYTSKWNKWDPPAENNIDTTQFFSSL